VWVSEAAQHSDLSLGRTSQRLQHFRVGRRPQGLSARAPNQPLHGKRAADPCVDAVVHGPECSLTELATLAEALRAEL